MSIASSTTAKQMASMSIDGQRLELLGGVIHMMSPAGNEHGRVASAIGWRIGPFVNANQLGDTYAAETGFLIEQNPDTVRAPDFAFIRQSRLDEIGSVQGFWPGAPDLVAEVVSPNDAYSDVEQKALQWLDCGCSVVWVVDPKQQHVTVYRSAAEISVLKSDAVLEAPALLPGWSLCVGDLFSGRNAG